MNLKKKDKIEISKDIIRKERKKIRLERRRRFREKWNKTIIKKKLSNMNDCKEEFTVKEQIISMIYFEIMGAILCLIILFVLSGCRNYFKLYKDLNKLINTYDTIQSNYYGKIDKNNLIDNAIKSMVTSVGDSYTTYGDKNFADDLTENLEGTYQGIGCMVSMNENDDIIVIQVFDDGPAKKAGIKENDIIIKIDNTDFKGKTSEDMSKYIKNSNKDKIKLTILRDNKEKDMTINRKKVEVPSVSSKIITKDDKKIGYMDISIFSSVTYNQFKNNLKKLEKEKIDGLIIDVRYDGGGYLTAVTDISSLFLKKGKTIYQLDDGKKKTKIKDETNEKRDYPVAVLINSSSASASEILAAAIKESYDKGIVVGTASYGKGTVQKTKILDDGSMLKYTIQHWLTPNGNWINEKGVEPTVKIELDKEGNTDSQLDKAIEEILKAKKGK